MTRHRSPDFGLRALRHDRLPFALLGALLLSMQLFIAGLTGGAMAAQHHAGHLGVLCIGGEEQASPAPATDGDHPRECPCLAGTCVQGGALAALDVPIPAYVPSAKPAEPVARPNSDRVDRRPLSLFARAGRGPPALS